jgi:hypothetical protein
MPLDNFSNLKASIKRRSKRNDITDADLVDYIAQCEAEFYNNAVAPLRIRSMEARATATTSTTSRFLALPDLFLQMRRLKLNDPFSGGIDTDIRYKSPEQLPIKGITAIPVYFTLTTQLEFDSTPDQEYTVEMQYIKRLTPLDDTNTTNDILTNHPNIYLFGSLWALFSEVQEFDVANLYYTQFIQAIQGANAADKAGRYGPSPAVRQEGYLP